MTRLNTIRLKLASAILKGGAGGPTPYDLASFFQSGQPIYTDMTVRKATREGYRMSIAVYRAVRAIVQAASGIPWVALDEEGGEEKVDHPVTQLLRSPNPEFSGQDLMEFTIAHLKLVGNALWCPVMLGGTPRELWMVMPDMVKPIPADQPGEWLKAWELKTAQGATSMLPPETFVHFMQFDPANPYWGVGDLQAASRTVDTDNEA